MTNKQAPLLITAGPAVVEIDAVRRITNHSTGALGGRLARHAIESGEEVILLRSTFSTAPAPEPHASLHMVPFATVDDLAQCLAAFASHSISAVWHAAAVGDYVVKEICLENGQAVSAGKLDSREGDLLMTLTPAPKLIARLVEWFPLAHRVGWKYEVEGTPESVMTKALRQMEENQTHACVANGPAWGSAFGMVLPGGQCVACADGGELSAALLATRAEFVRAGQ
ncbi:MAG: phosphopantothenoylcysteine decarboxylase [Candidatus Methylacidiphilales bacterium]